MKPKDRDRLKRKEEARALGKVAKMVNGKLASLAVNRRRLKLHLWKPIMGRPEHPTTLHSYCNPSDLSLD